MGIYVLLHPFTERYRHSQAEITTIYYPGIVELVIGARSHQITFYRNGFRDWNYVSGKATCSRGLSKALEECLKKGSGKASMFAI